MRAAVYFLTFVVGVSVAAIPKQNPAPVYIPSQSVISSPGNAVNGKSSLPAALQAAYPPPSNNNAGSSAEEREGQAYRQVEEPGSPTAPNGSPSQNYVVYYYTNPNAKTNAGYQAVSSPHAHAASTSYLSTFNMRDAGSILLSAALIGGGIYLVSSPFASVKSRALRELKDMKAEDAARMAKSVMRALERVYELSSSSKQ